jgi:hypothetical protein
VSTPLTEDQASDSKNEDENDDAALIDDDGRTLWASPTTGGPLDLGYLPPGVQIIIALRPKAIVEHSEGEKVIASLGPLGETALTFLDDVLRSPAGVDHCLIGIQATSSGRWETTLVARLAGRQSAQEHLRANFPDGVENAHNATKYWLANDWAYLVTNSSDEQLFVASSPDLIGEIIDLGGAPPPLRRDVARLLEHTDAERHATVVIAPNFLFSEGSAMFAGGMAALRRPLYWFLGDELSAAALSMHLDENLFVELVAAPMLDTQPEAATRILATRVAEMPEHVENYVIGLDAHSFGRRIVARFPTMVRKLAAYTRAGVDANHAVLRCYLPAVAGHNLLMGAELTLAEATGHTAVVGQATAPTHSETSEFKSLGERLRQKTSLSFARDTLEAALDQLSNNIGIEILINGADLQAEGITKNQSFGIDLSEKPAEEILVEILRLANPDKTAIGPADPRQKLVYVAVPTAGGAGRVVITTRGRAAERGEDLPSVFQAEQP